MKKFINILCLSFFALLVLLPLSAQTESEGIVEVVQDDDLSMGSNNFLVDEAGLLTADQAQVLEERLSAISKQYGSDVVIVTKPDIAGSNITAYADDYFDGNSYGQGEENEGILFLITMAEREWAISTCGYNTITIFSDWRQEQISGTMMPHLKEGDYFGAFEVFANKCEYYFGRGVPSDSVLTSEENGGETEKGPLDPVWGFFSMLIGLVSSWIGTSAKRSRYRTVFEKETASGYENIKRASGRNSDSFLRTNVNKTLRMKESPRTSYSGFSHSSTHTSSSGHTHGGSHGSF